MNSDGSDDEFSAAHAESIAEPGTDEEIEGLPSNLLSLVCFQTARPTDIPACYKLEQSSYPEDEAASKSSLQYRQHHAAPYFRCAVLKERSGAENASAVAASEDDEHRYTIIGFVCSTRCKTFDAESMLTHVPDGPLLAIHSVVVHPNYRKQGVASALLNDYVKTIQKLNKGAVKNDVAPISTIVLIAKKALLTFYIHCGFQVVRPSKIVHGKDLWYELEYSLKTTIRQKRQGLPCYIVDAFVDPESKFGQSGNPAAVVLVEKNHEEGKEDEETDGENENETLNAEWMQAVANEFNLSETAFVLPKPSSTSDNTKLHYTIRFFTPTMEVLLCGHATLAAASVVYQTACRKSQRVDTTVVFHAKQDVLQVTYCPALQGHTKLSMQFPCKPAQEVIDNEQLEAVKKMLEAAFWIASDSILYIGVAGDIGDLLVELSHESFCAIRYAGLKYNALLDWDGYSRGVIICCRAPPAESKSSCTEEDVEEETDDGKNNDNDNDDDDDDNNMSFPAPDFFLRFFAPKSGINEDPVTGSAHSVLAPYFGHKLGKDRLVSRQQSARGGVVECRLTLSSDSSSEKTVEITGLTNMTVSGTLWL